MARSLRPAPADPARPAFDRSGPLDVPEVAFLAKAVEQFREHYNVDPDASCSSGSRPADRSPT